MIPKLKHLTEPGPGSSVWELMDDDHYWWNDNGVWHCTCDGESVDWTWEEIVDDIGPDSTSYVVEAAR